MDLMSRNGELVKLKIFAMQIKFQFNCFRGEEDHLKAAIALLVNKQSFSPPNPYTPWLGEASKFNVFAVHPYSNCELKSE